MPKVKLCYVILHPMTHILSGLKVIDCTAVIAAPTAAMMLGELGMANKEIGHQINNEVVMTYHSPQLSADAASAEANPQLTLNQGFTALQSASHPIDFRRVALGRLDKE